MDPGRGHRVYPPLTGGDRHHVHRPRRDPPKSGPQYQCPIPDASIRAAEAHPAYKASYVLTTTAGKGRCFVLATEPEIEALKSALTSAFDKLAGKELTAGKVAMARLGDAMN